LIAPFFSILLRYVLLGTTFLCFSIGCNKLQKVAFIRNGQLISEYQGIKEARSVHFKSRTDKMTSLDSLNDSYKRFSLEKDPDQFLLRDLQQKIFQTQNWLSENSEFTTSEVFQGSLNQINSFVKSYAENNGIDLVLGVTADGNIMYGSNELDITEEVLIELNKNYRN
jgi:outer membrane protein